MAAFDLGDLGRFIGASNKLPMGAGAYAGANSLGGAEAAANMRRQGLSMFGGITGKDAAKMPRIGGSGDLSSVVVPQGPPLPPKQMAAPFAGLADAIKSQTERATRQAVQPIVADTRRRQQGPVAASAPSARGGSAEAAPRSSKPVGTLTRLVRGAY
jgi:hypothetical protein